jgi:hypothetical protein
VAILPVMALAGWVYVRAHDREIQVVDDTHLLLARNLGAALERYARDAISAFELSAKTAVAGDKTDMVAKLMGDLNFVHLCLARADTGEIVGSFVCPPRVPA